MVPRLLLSATLLVVGGAGCAGSGPTAPPAPKDATLLIRARVSSDAVATLVVEVTGPGITVPLVFNLEFADRVAKGTVIVPTGSQRVFAFHAFDGGGVETHRGSVTVDIKPGNNPTVGIVLDPLASDVPIDVELGEVSIVVLPAADTLEIGDVVSLKARVTNADGEPVSEPVRWATLAPNIARGRYQRQHRTGHGGGSRRDVGRGDPRRRWRFRQDRGFSQSCAG